MAVLNKFAPMNIAQLEAAKDSSVFVINNTNPRGMLHVSVGDGSGSNIAVTVPITNIPVDLTTQATKQSLVNSPRFRALVMQRAVLIVPSDFANEELQRPDFQSEVERVYKVLSNGAGMAQADFANSVLGDAKTVNEDELKADNISPFAMAIAHNVDEEGSSNGDNLIYQMQQRPGELKLEDFEYIARNSQFANVKAFASEQAADIRAAI